MTQKKSRDKFAEWVREFGFLPLARALSQELGRPEGRNRVSRATVHGWVRRDPRRRNVPQPRMVAAIVSLSRRQPLSVGPLKAADIYAACVDLAIENVTAAVQEVRA